VGGGETWHLFIVGAIERFLFMNASTSASVTFFLRWMSHKKMAIFRVGVGVMTNLLELANKLLQFAYAFCFELPSQQLASPVFLEIRVNVWYVSVCNETLQNNDRTLPSLSSSSSSSRKNVRY